MWWGYQHLRHVMIDRFGSSLFATSWPGRCKSVSEGEEASNRGTCPAMAKCQRSSLVRKHGSIDWVNSCRRRTLGYAVSLFELGDHIGVFFNQFSLWSCSCNDKSQWQLREKRGGPKGGYGEECDWRAILWKVSSTSLAWMSSRHPVEAWEACEDPLHESILLFIWSGMLLAAFCCLSMLYWLVMF